MTPGRPSVLKGGKAAGAGVRFNVALLAAALSLSACHSGKPEYATERLYPANGSCPPQFPPAGNGGCLLPKTYKAQLGTRECRDMKKEAQCLALNEGAVEHAGCYWSKEKRCVFHETRSLWP